MLAQKITNHCSISSSGLAQEGDGGGGGRPKQAVIRGAFCVGLSGGRKEMNQAGEEEERCSGRPIDTLEDTKSADITNYK